MFLTFSVEARQSFLDMTSDVKSEDDVLRLVGVRGQQHKVVAGNCFSFP